MDSNDDRYFLLKREHPRKLPEGLNVATFYDKLATPWGVFGMLGSFFVLIHGDIGSHFEGAARGIFEERVYLLLILTTGLIGYRLMQSLYLAKQDYRNFSTSPFFDLTALFLISAFTSGGIIKIVQTNVGIQRNIISIVFLIYTLSALYATYYFYKLLTKRLPKNTNELESVLEKRIQLVNFIVFLGIFSLFALSYGAIGLNIFPDKTAYYALPAIACLTIFNISHSSYLTIRPKFLLSNECDSIDHLTKDYFKQFKHLFNSDIESLLKELLHNNQKLIHKEVFIKTARATKKDARLIATLLIAEFHYIYQYIMMDDDRDKLINWLEKMITCAGGIGTLGYLNFYFILNDKNTKVGLFKIESWHTNLFYEIWFALAFIFELFTSKRKLGDIVKIINRARTIIALQNSTCDEFEFGLTYLIIFEENRHQGFGTAFLHLIINAFVKNQTNNVFANRIKLISRESNSGAKRIFEQADFKPYVDESIDYAVDPFKEVPAVGPQVFFEYKRETLPAKTDT